MSVKCLEKNREFLEKSSMELQNILMAKKKIEELKTECLKDKALKPDVSSSSLEKFSEEKNDVLQKFGTKFENVIRNIDLKEYEIDSLRQDFVGFAKEVVSNTIKTLKERITEKEIHEKTLRELNDQKIKLDELERKLPKESENRLDFKELLIQAVLEGAKLYFRSNRTN